MIVATAVCYWDSEEGTCARASAVAFDEWTSTKHKSVHSALFTNVSPYVHGELYRRELPILQALLEEYAEQADLFIIRGYASLPERKALGEYLYDTLGVPVVGVAPRKFEDESCSVPVSRVGGTGQLFVTSCGCPLTEATTGLMLMPGASRLPAMLDLAERHAQGPSDSRNSV